MKLKSLFYYFCILLIFTCSWIYSHDENIEKIRFVLAEIPEWNTANVEIDKLGGGLTNENYRLRLGLSTFFVRCSNSQNSVLGSSLKREWQSSSIASAYGLAPKVILYCPTQQIMITDFIDTQGRKVNLRDPQVMHHFCNLIQLLHQQDAEFLTDFCPFKCIEEYVKNARSLEAPLPDIFFNEVLPGIELLKTTTHSPSKKVACHLDLHHENVLDDGNRLWLIDWEYAAMADPFFDLAVLTSTEDFSDAEMLQLLQIYLNDRMPTTDEIDHFYKMRILADARWALWCYIQSKISPINASFSASGDTYLNHCLDRLNAR